MKMITYYYVRSSQKPGGIDSSKISERYTLNQGHAYMWYDKFGFIKERFKQICLEMRDRDFRCDYDVLNYTGIPESAFGDFIPTQTDIKTNLDRVLIRLAKQPKWYSYLGKRIDDWDTFYLELFKKREL
jgi:hypothetical protein